MKKQNDNHKDVDQESVIGYTSDETNNNEPRATSDGQSEERRAVQCLLKDDSVLTLNWQDGGGWSVLLGQRSRKGCTFNVGTVIIDKNWEEMKLSMKISWGNGKYESLRGGTIDVACGDRIFVLDRRCISKGSKVSLVGHPELNGTVLDKRYLATGKCTKNPALIFEDIDVSRLRRETHGTVYKDTKIMFHGWLGIISGLRTRVYLQSHSEDACFFSIIVDGDISQSFNIGDEVKLGFKILRGAEFVCHETGNNNWLVNFFRFYNTTASVVDCEIDQLYVCWIGKASTPNTTTNQGELSEAPDDSISHDELFDVHYLLGNNYHHMTNKSLWIFQCSEDDISVSHDKWVQKWKKLVGWDQWEYPTTDEHFVDSSCYLHKHLTLEIMYIRSVLDIQWNSGSIGTLSCGDVIPLYVGGVWSEMSRFHIGSIVYERMDEDNKDKYGIIVSLDEEFSATVKWITPLSSGIDEEGAKPTITVSTASLYNLVVKPEYEYISKPNQFPLVTCGKDLNVGVVVGINAENHMVLVNLTGHVQEHYWPHQLTHYKCDILLCSKENRWTLWYEHLRPPSGFTRVGPNPHASSENYSRDPSDVSIYLGSSMPKQKLDCIEKVPLDNIFVLEDMLLRTRETSFYGALEKEIAEMSLNLPDGMWVEHYVDRVDIFSTIVTGPKDSLFEDFIFVFDIFLMEDFPKSEPHINFRSFDVTLVPGHLCKSGAVFLPEETRITDEDFSYSYMLNLLLEMKDFLALPIEFIHERYAEQKVGMKFVEGPEELYNFITLALLDYTLALLRNPPKNWCSVIRKHFTEAFPRIAERFGQGSMRIKRILPSINNEEGDFPKSEEFEVITIPWNEAFFKSVNGRVADLQKIYESLLE